MFDARDRARACPRWSSLRNDNDDKDCSDNSAIMTSWRCDGFSQNVSFSHAPCDSGLAEFAFNRPNATSFERFTFQRFNQPRLSSRCAASVSLYSWSPTFVTRNQGNIRFAKLDMLQFGIIDYPCRLWGFPIPKNQRLYVSLCRSTIGIFRRGL